jgi:hypothetical protein
MMVELNKDKSKKITKRKNKNKKYLFANNGV